MRGTDPQKYLLKVTAGPSYENQEDVHVNTNTPAKISSEHIDAHVHVRVKDFRGLPKTSPALSPYFSHPTHTRDLYSISFSFIPKRPISGNDLVFGNDFDHPIRDKLPPLFGKAFSYVTSFIDPGLYGDPYADAPYLYGPMLSSVNVFRVGEKEGLDEEYEEGEVLEEGAEDEEGEGLRKKAGLPSVGSKRMKHFLQEGKRKEWESEEGRVYSCDFFNPYLDFNQFALKLPLGLSLNILGNWDGQALRYVLRDRKTDVLLFVVSFNLVPIEHVDGDEDPTVKKEDEAKKEDDGKSGEVKKEVEKKHEDWEDDLD
ncbi:hypothetical protein EG327_006723 [Venturia inaequalis]|uniref:Domain of unknown function at the cortex 1 domain-containing protein n=1 Tax=Venturia inaequalis TaxID=5025 RepID=A0A8H3YZK0_VENIN|nr:hypothetical protein EG327_006723 [Venturia inaequalis]